MATPSRCPKVLVRGFGHLSSTTNKDLRVLICEDEYLLAMDMAEQFEALQAQVVGIVGTMGDLERTIAASNFAANAVVLDLQFVDGNAYDIIPRLEKTGAAVVICSGYNVDERPAELAHIPWVNKPATAEMISGALRSTLDTLRDRQGI
jgi:CheY-like chemotaxis protein